MQLTREWAKRTWLWAIGAAVLLTTLAGVSSVAAQPSTPDPQAMLAACQAYMAQFGSTMSGMMGSMGSGMSGMMGSMGSGMGSMMGGTGGMGLR